MRSKTSAVCIAVLSAALLLGACDESEQGRMLSYEKGTYLGAPDADLSAEQLDALRQRATLQGAN